MGDVVAAVVGARVVGDGVATVGAGVTRVGVGCAEGDDVIGLPVELSSRILVVFMSVPVASVEVLFTSSRTRSGSCLLSDSPTSLAIVPSHAVPKSGLVSPLNSAEE